MRQKIKPILKRLLKVVIFIPWMFSTIIIVSILPIVYILTGDVYPILDWHSSLLGLKKYTKNMYEQED